MSKSKKGVSKVIVVILLILLVLALIVILWLILKNLLKEQGEITEAKAELIDMNVDIDDVNISETASTVNITISRGAGRMVLKNVTIIKKQVYADVFSVVDLSGSMIGDKLDAAQEANRVFVNKILSNSSQHRVGLVTYARIVNESYSHSLTNVESDLILKINNWIAYGSTCICCGINNATARILADWKEDKFKAIVVMSDGEANVNCSGGWLNAKENAIQAASDAYSNGIKVYAVGFGQAAADAYSNGITVYAVGSGVGFVYPDLDQDTLKNISKAGHGNYSYADISDLEAIYTQISEEIIEHYEEEQYDHLKVMFYNDTTFCEQKIPLPQGGSSLPLPLETRTYQLVKCIENIKEIQIYPVVYTPSGIQVIGPRLDSWIIS